MPFRIVLLASLTVIMVMNAAAVFGQTAASNVQPFPNRPIRVLTTGVGGGSDTVSRLVGMGVTENTGQAVIVDNRATNVVAQIAARAPPDGYTIISVGTAQWLAPFLQLDVAYDPVKDFLPITLAVTSPNVLVVPPSLPVTSVKDLIALAKAKPGTLNYASIGIGSSNHLAAELFKAMAGISIVHVPYKANALALTDLIAGRAQLLFASAASAAPHVKAGRVKSLAVTSAHPTALFPGVPTVAASGVPNYESISEFGMFAPAKTPGVIINTLNQQIVSVLNRADVKEKLFGMGIEVVASSPQEFAAVVKADMTKWGKVIKDSGIRAD